MHLSEVQNSELTTATAIKVAQIQISKEATISNHGWVANVETQYELEKVMTSAVGL